ncbi:MAG TPA: xanthine dehydrogenase family protein molybdopterin-binding subunit [Noviherbaspirillum sp.]
MDKQSVIPDSEAGMSRRAFLRSSAATGAGLLLSFYLPSGIAGDDAPADGATAMQDASPMPGYAPNAWLRITPDNRIVFTLDRVEMGQGTMTSHATLIAEELEVSPSKIEVAFADGRGGDFNNPKFGIQLTGGSTSVSSSWEPLRRAGASAREMLRAAAAKRLGVPVSEVTATDGLLHHRASKRSLSYGEVCLDAAKERAPQVQLKDPAHFRYIGKPQKRLDTHQKVMGTAKFGIDVSVPGMVNAYIVRSPVIGSRLKGFDDSEARKQPGVIATVRLPHGVAIVAQHWYQAKKAAGLLKADWDAGMHATTNSAQIMAKYRELTRSDGKKVRADGNPDAGFAQSAHIVEATYDAPYLAHATMEPQNCVAHVREDSCEIWAPTQWPQLAREVAARLTGLSHAQIQVNQTFVGGGFGRRIRQDYVEDAVLVSAAVKRPVKVIWTREDDMKHDFYRPAAASYFKAGLDGRGEVTAYFARVVTQSIVSASAQDFVSTMAPTWVPHGLKRMTASMASDAYKGILPDETTVEGTATFAYAFPNHRVEYVNQDPGVPIGFWRSVGHSFNAFMAESFVDELAHAAKQDPYQFRRKLLKDAPRLLRVLDLAAEKAGWGQPLPAGVHRGIAIAESFSSVVAQVAEISLVDKQIVVRRIVAAVDCGMVVNPDIVRAQVESAVIFGLSAALKGQITIENGQVQQSNFHDYEVVRIQETPLIETHVVPSADAPTGIGEPGLPPLAPAVANAVFAASGKRLRSLPLRL